VSARDTPLVIGAVAYDPKVVTIWEGFRAWFAAEGLPIDYVLYSNYERLVDDLMAGVVDVAWASPLAWVRARRLAEAAGREVRAVAMRDTDCDLTSVVVVRGDSGIDEVGALRGRTVGVGAIDSPQATLLPLSLLRARGLVPGEDVRVRRFDVLGGKHGDHIGGEREAAAALVAGDVDAACMIAGNHRLFLDEGVLTEAGSRVIDRTPSFDHCTFAATDSAPPEAVERFRDLLLSMSYDDPGLRPLLDLEGLRAWVPGRTEGFAPLEGAVDQARFYDDAGAIVEAEYVY
jgi:ABC-type phosphate/phosphonate transport system substrate-binding protein